MSIRLIARVIGNPVGKTKHYHGLPPDLTGDKDALVELEPAKLLVIEQRPEGVFLFRFLFDGRCVGDTWHQTIEDAKHQADFEFSGSVSSWQAIPAEVKDAVGFGVKLWSS